MTTANEPAAMRVTPGGRREHQFDSYASRLVRPGRLLLVIAFIVGAAGCPMSGGDDGGGVDGGGIDEGRMDGGGIDDRGAGPCATASDCDDGLYCNGNEQCAPTDPRSDARGCLTDGPACASFETCDEATRACSTRDAAGGACSDEGYYECLGQVHQCCGGHWIVYYDGPCWTPDAGTGPDCTGPPVEGCPCTGEGSAAPCASFNRLLVCHSGSWAAIPSHACCS